MREQRALPRGRRDAASEGGLGLGAAAIRAMRLPRILGIAGEERPGRGGGDRPPRRRLREAAPPHPYRRVLLVAAPHRVGGDAELPREGDDRHAVQLSGSE